MRRRAKVGLLPLYLELYDQVDPRLRETFKPFLAEIVEGFSLREVDVVQSEICRVKAEFQTAVTEFEREEVDIVVAVHLAYSPSLESAEILASSPLPLLLLDTTMDCDFGPDVDPQRLMYNHGIHGVQDLASVLRCKKRSFEIVAGHVSESDLMRRACDIAKAALAAKRLCTMSVLRIGESFPGMGDFAVPDEILRKELGVTVQQIESRALANHVRAVAEEEIQREIETDNRRFAVDSAEATHRRSVRIGLGLRRLLNDGQFGALSVDFRAFDTDEGPVDAVPFLEVSKAMSRGLGYAGEGDALTASLVGALNSAFGETTFTETFCPDWKGGTLFISHMGEINPDISREKARLIERDFPWTDAHNPAVLTCAPAPGAAVLVNLSPGPEETFQLLIAPVEVMEDSPQPAFRDHIRGWLRPPCSVAAFLEEYSRWGGTHHSALLLGDRVEALTAFAKFAKLESRLIPTK